jgi:hypothetical protein
MSSDDAQFIAELAAWLRTSAARRESLLATKVIAETTLDQILGGRYNPSEKLRTNLRAQMVVIDTEGQRVATG